MATPAHTIATFLAAASVGTLGGTAAWSIFVAREPVTPADVITLYDYDGGEPDTDQLDLLPRVQVRTRSGDYAASYAKHETIRDLLILNSPVAGFVDVQLISGPMAIGYDENNRHLITANYRAIKQRS
jgi:hypothetical protein